ncbi:28S ribosomal protein S31, mitochondrial [Betta splendens]|uniref:Small ribosomal subunit protein mS31 n=1 Tax=Betta splendens TaxID=158456 RepID=A0A6P7PAX2_BETSP|nr:28S ribosomal protein S31, mitochondrial [Betta splendens]
MYKFLLRSVYVTRSSPNGIYESFLLSTECNKAFAPVLRLKKGYGDKAFSTSSISLCDDDHSEKRNADKVTDQTKSSPVVTQKDKDDAKVSNIDDQSEKPVTLKTNDGDSAKQQMEVKVEHIREIPKQENTDAPQSAKMSLLNLIGAMKVDVTAKRNLKKLKAKQNPKPGPKAMPADMESTVSMFQKAKMETLSQSETLDPKLVEAAAAAASTMPNRTRAESDLLRQLRQHEAITDAQKKGDMNNLGVIIADMKVGKNLNQQKAWSTNPIRFDEDGQGYTHDRGITTELDSVRRRSSLYTGKRLNIFSPATNEDGVESTVGRPTLWDLDFANQLCLVTNQMPRNRFEEMIQWTKEGKMWQYPINNEAGLEEEASVPFHEHVFLEKHLEEGFPREGPVRHFMELVVTGLSKNPYLTVQQKKEHISWFRDYFHQKEDVLRDADVFLN